MRGATFLELKELLGHKDIKSTLRYAHLMPEHKHDVVAVLDDPPPVKRQHSGNREEEAV
jgi:integrase